jgi:RNA-directed DNA polymerase
MCGRVADRSVVLMMAAKETSCPEGRPRPLDIPEDAERNRTQGRIDLPSGLQRVEEAAARSHQTRFTALMHHVNDAALIRAFRRQRRAAASGVDGVTVDAYKQNLTENIRRLCEAIHTERYRPLPVRRVHIPKPDGGERPLGIAALEDKIVQSAVAELLSAIYEADFLDCSYGFRPERNCHQALHSVFEAVMGERVNWVLEADIRSFFDSVDHDWLLRMLALRIADPKVLRLVGRWLKAGVLERAVYAETVEGVPQGAGISPLLANVFLHYALDLWVGQWMRRVATGRMRLVRYADDFVITFERREDAERMRTDLTERLAKFGLRVHEGKTRLIEFGRFAEERRQRRGQPRPETFDFLGFTHICGKTRNGRFVLKRRTQRKRMMRKLKALRQEMWGRMHWLLKYQHRWLSAVLQGHYAYFGIRGNAQCVWRYLREVERAWIAVLRRRGQRPHLPWTRFRRWLHLFPLPQPRSIRA